MSPVEDINGPYFQQNISTHFQYMTLTIMLFILALLEKIDVYSYDAFTLFIDSFISQR